MKAFLFVILMICVSSQSIFLGLKGRDTRCMIEYIAGSGLVNTVKIKINLPEISNIEMGQHYYITIKNTESNETKAEAVKPGLKYVRQEQFVQNVIYEICVNFRTNRDLETVIEYEAQNSYNYKQQVIKVPENLLKVADFKEAFVAASYIESTMSQYKKEHSSRTQNKSNEFQLTEEINHNLMVVSVIELMVLVGAGLYQFTMLQKYLSSKQYI